MGLVHTFTGECTGGFTDLVPDTPREKRPVGGVYCPKDLDSCPDSPDTDPIHNHMTYTGDECRTELTEDRSHLCVSIWGYSAVFGSGNFGLCTLQLSSLNCLRSRTYRDMHICPIIERM